MEAEKQTNRVSIDSEVCVLPLSSFVLEPDYADIAKEVATYVTTSFTSNPLVGRLPTSLFVYLTGAIAACSILNGFFYLS